MAATLRMHREEHILEWTPTIPEISSVIKEKTEYYVCTAKDCWVFPWKDTQLPINVNTMSVSDNVCGIATTCAFCEDRLNVYPRIVTSLFDVSFLRARGKGILPKRVKAGTMVARIVFVKQIECQLVLT